MVETAGLAVVLITASSVEEGKRITAFILD